MTTYINSIRTASKTNPVEAYHDAMRLLGEVNVDSHLRSIDLRTAITEANATIRFGFEYRGCIHNPANAKGANDFITLAFIVRATTVDAWYHAQASSAKAAASDISWRLVGREDAGPHGVVLDRATELIIAAAYIAHMHDVYWHAYNVLNDRMHDKDNGLKKRIADLDTAIAEAIEHGDDAEVRRLSSWRQAYAKEYERLHPRHHILHRLAQALDGYHPTDDTVITGIERMEDGTTRIHYRNLSETKDRYAKMYTNDIGPWFRNGRYNTQYLYEFVVTI